MTETNEPEDTGSLEHTHAKFAHLREEKRRAAAEAEARESVKDLYEDG